MNTPESILGMIATEAFESKEIDMSDNQPLQAQAGTKVVTYSLVELEHRTQLGNERYVDVRDYDAITSALEASQARVREVEEEKFALRQNLERVIEANRRLKLQAGNADDCIIAFEKATGGLPKAEQMHDELATLRTDLERVTAEYQALRSNLKDFPVIASLVQAMEVAEARCEGLRSALDAMLNAAQTLRIQQVQATVGWEKHYTDKADAAWKAINEAHRAAIEGTEGTTAPAAPQQ